MSNSELIRLAEQFEKEAGTLKYPAKTFNEMNAWCSSIIATRILSNIDTKIAKMRPPRPGMNKAQARAIRQKIVEFRLIRNELKNIIKGSGFQQDASGHSVTNTFEIDTDALPYREPKAERSHEDDQLVQVAVRVMFSKKTSIPTGIGPRAYELRPSSPAFYLPGERMIVIDGSDCSEVNSVEDLKNYISNRAYFLRHELQHAVQFQMSSLKAFRDETSDIFGLGPKNQRKEWDDDGSTPHALKAVEFYTRLSDDLRAFRTIKSHIPPIYSRVAFYYWICEIDAMQFENYILRDMVKRSAPRKPESDLEHDKRIDKASKDFTRLLEMSHIGPSDFFSSLKKHNMEAYKKAVKEFSKEIGAIL